MSTTTKILIAGIAILLIVFFLAANGIQPDGTNPVETLYNVTTAISK